MKYIIFSMLLIGLFACKNENKNKDSNEVISNNNESVETQSSNQKKVQYQPPDPANLSPLAKNVQGKWGALVQGVTGSDTLNIDFEIEIQGYDIRTSSHDTINGRLEVEELYETKGDTLKRFAVIEGNKEFSQEHIIVEGITDSSIRINIIASEANSRLELFRR